MAFSILRELKISVNTGYHHQFHPTPLPVQAAWLQEERFVPQIEVLAGMLIVLVWTPDGLFACQSTPTTSGQIEGCGGFALSVSSTGARKRADVSWSLAASKLIRHHALPVLRRHQLFRPSTASMRDLAVL